MGGFNNMETKHRNPNEPASRTDLTAAFLKFIFIFIFFKHLNILTNSWKFYAQKGEKKKKKIEEY